MTDTVRNLDGTPVLVCAAGGPPVRTDRDALDLMVAAREHGADWIAVPVARLDEGFFTLSTGVAGEILHKLVMYQVKLAVLGDISRYTAESASFRSFAEETNRGRQAWFVSNLDELRARLSRVS